MSKKDSIFKILNLLKVLCGLEYDLCCEPQAHIVSDTNFLTKFLFIKDGV